MDTALCATVYESLHKEVAVTVTAYVSEAEPELLVALTSLMPSIVYGQEDTAVPP